MSMIKIPLTVLFLIASVYGSWEDGEIEQGEVYSKISFHTLSYSGYQFPYGIDWKELIPVGNGNSAVIAGLEHVPCPRGKNCDKTKLEQLTLRVDLKTMTIDSLANLALSKYGELWTQGMFTPEVVGNYTYFLTYRPSRVVQVDIRTAIPERSYPEIGLGDDENIRAASIDSTREQVAILNASNKTIDTIDLESMHLLLSYAIPPKMIEFTRVMADGASGFKYITGWREDKVVGIVPIPYAGIAMEFVELHGGKTYTQVDVRKVFRIGDYMYVVVQSYSNTDNTKKVDVQRYLLDKALIPRYDKSVHLGMRGGFQAHIYDSSTRSLYLLSQQGSISKINMASYSLVGTMTMYTNNKSPHWQTTNPGTASIFVSEPGKTAFVGTSYSGHLIKVNLEEFCDDNDPKCQPDRPSPGDDGDMSGFAVAVLVLMCLGVVSLIVGYLVNYNQHGKRGFEAVPGIKFFRGIGDKAFGTDKYTQGVYEHTKTDYGSVSN